MSVAIVRSYTCVIAPSYYFVREYHKSLKSVGGIPNLGVLRGRTLGRLVYQNTVLPHGGQGRNPANAQPRCQGSSSAHVAEGDGRPGHLPVVPGNQVKQRERGRGAERQRGREGGRKGERKTEREKYFKCVSCCHSCVLIERSTWEILWSFP